jgi:ribonuclease HI
MSSKIKEIKLDTEPDGMVLYSDGGCLKQGFGGWGLHGYTYSNEPAKKGSGNNSQYLLNDGYVEKSTTLGNKPVEVKPLKYIDGFGSFSYPVTNNIAEIAGATFGLEVGAKHNIKDFTLYTDSMYVVNGATQWLPGWKQNGWIKRDGMPVSNKNEWLALDNNLALLKEKGVKVEIKWVKGHSTYLGNQIADKYATIGTLHASNYKDRVEISTQGAEGYWSNKEEKHPFFCHKRIYFVTRPDSIVPGEYYLGDHGKDDDLIGKRMADGCYSYIKLATPEPFVEMLRNKQVVEANGKTAIIMGRIDKLFESKTHADLANFGEVCFYLPSTRKLDMHFIDKEPVTKELNPPKLAMRAVDSVNKLKGVLLAAQDPTDTSLCFTNITSLIYEIDSKDNYKLKPEFTVGFTSFPVQIFYGEREGSATQEKIDVCMGIDMPDRNAMKRLEKLKPIVKVVTWMESLKTFRYAIMVTAGADVGIWAGMYSNLRILV